MRRVWLGIVASIILASLSFAPAQAANETNRGLFVTPVREYVSVAPGTTAQKQVTIANITDNPVAVSLSVERFSVADYSYDYTFSADTEKWLQLSETQVELQPGKSKAVTYTAAPPANTTPGGHYFTIFATATVQNGSVKSQVRAATVVYATVEGELKVGTALQNISIPRVSFGGDIDFSMDVTATGNTHFFIYVAGELEGLTSKGRGTESTRLLMPGATLKVGSTIPAPLLPGVYKAVYGYKTDSGETVERWSHVVYVPLWSLVIPVGIVWLVVAFIRRRGQVVRFRTKDS